MAILYYLPWISAAALISSVVFSATSLTKERYFAIAKYLYYLTTAIVGSMLSVMLVAFIANWFELSYVYNHSSRDLPLMYRIAAVWAGQEGSFVLWAFFVMICGTIVLRVQERYQNVFLTLIGLVSLIFIIHCINNNPFRFIWETSHHFAPDVIPEDGAGLNPLLQDFWMIIHPPVMFMGYAVAAIPFIFALIALVYNNYTIILKSYRWVVATVLLLGAGNFLGGYWAYKVLGWGGYWAWDPVENSSLIPWLISIALLHGLLLQRRRNALIRLNLFLAIVTFVLVLFGTFLTRSGVLSDFSVHSFSGAGNFTDLLLFIITIIALSIGLIVYRRKDAIGKELDTTLLSRENIIVYGIAALVFFALFVLIGTVMPIITGVLGHSSTVNESYYTSIAKPISSIILILLLLTPFTKPPKIMQGLLIGVFALLFTILIYLGQQFVFVPFVVMLLAFGIILSNSNVVLPHIPVNAAARVAHVGIAVMVIGIITSQTQSKEYHAELLQKEKKSIPPITLSLIGMSGEKKDSIVFQYAYNRSSAMIQTPYFIDSRTNQLFREPYIDYNILYDVYISPVEYRKGYDTLTKIMLQKGAVREFNDITIRFDGFDIDKVAMMGGNPKIYALCMVQYKGKPINVKPGVVFTEDEKKSIPAVIPGTNRKIVLIDFDITEKIIVLHIDPPADATIPPDSVIVDISFKRLIWLVWLGTVLIAIGVACPLVKRS